MGPSLEKPEYCKVCGSTSLVNANISIARDKSGREFNVSTAFAGGGYKSGNKKSQMATYQTYVCTLCNNEQESVSESSTSSDPIIIQPSPEDIPVIIPFTLKHLLKPLGYRQPELEVLVRSLRDKLLDIRTRYAENGGQNPCEDGRVGYKMRLELDNDLKPQCRVIVGQEQGEFAFRLAFSSKVGVC